MKKQGYKESTIRPSVRALKAIAKRTDLLDPEKVKEYLAYANVSENRKNKLSDDLARFYRCLNISFDRPRYRKVQRLPFIPLEQEIDSLISGVGRKTAAFLQLLKETGVRAGEAWSLKWCDLDFQGSYVTVTPEKGSEPRRLRLSNCLVAILNSLPRKSQYVFHNSDVDPMKSLDDFTRNFQGRRKLIALKLQNPRICQISFKTFRHFKATTLYAKTKDILLVMRTLGHKNINNTLVYTHLVDFQNDDWICKTAGTVDEAKTLVESGFEYVTEIENVKLFRKRK
jgi:integrase